MAEAKAPKQVNADRKNPRRNGKICEYMTYSGREAIKRLRTNVMIALDDGSKKNRIIGVTSAQPSEGKSTVSINLAYSLAELGKTVVLIDGDMRRPTVHESVGINLTPGLSDVLNGSENLNNSIVRYQSTTDQTHFDMITSGAIPDNPSELLNSSRFKKFLEVVSGAFDIVLIDLPPVNTVVDAVNVCQYIDGMIFVIRENHCPNYVLASAIEQLRYAKANILGFVMNGCVEGAGKHYQYKQPYYQSKK